MVPWHRILGLVLTDLFTGSPFEVEMEKDLSARKQLLDIAIVRKTGPVPPSLILPDGLEGLSDFNLFTYKSLHQAVDAWALQELIGHYVNYRKLLVEPSGALLPEASFRLYALSTREPEVLSSHHGIEAGDRPGIYDVTWFQPSLRLIVLSQTETKPENGLWQLFSGRADRVADAARTYRFRRRDLSTVVNSLFEAYGLEGLNMPYTVTDYLKEEALRLREILTPEERLEGLEPEERLKGLDPEDVLRAFRHEDLLEGIDPQEIEAYLRKIRSGQQLP